LTHMLISLYMILAEFTASGKVNMSVVLEATYAMTLLSLNC